MIKKTQNIPVKAPTAYAEELGDAFIASKDKNEIVSLGQYLTPRIVAEMMAGNFNEAKTESIAMLDPGAGSGVLSCALCENITRWKNRPRRIELECYEIDHSLIPVLKKSLTYLKQWLIDKDIDFSFSINAKDFVLESADILDRTLQCGLFDKREFEKFDFIIANPPYFKIPKSDARARAAKAVVYGQPNIYALFMAISGALLKEKGQLGFITPRSYAAGLYFKRFRQHFFKRIRPVSIHIFEARDRAFKKDGVLQENIILHGEKNTGTDESGYRVKVSSCKGILDMENSSAVELPAEEIISHQDGYVLHIPTELKQRETVRMVKSWEHNLHSLGFEVSTGPIVPFRAREILARNPQAQSVPLLWIQNIRAMQVSWPIESRKHQYVKVTDEAKKLLVPTSNYVLVRRFSSKEEKKRIVAAPLTSRVFKSEFVGIENHVNYIYRKSGELSEIEALGLAAILNSSFLDVYFRVFNGNTQVSATELRNLPLPPSQAIEKVGTLVKTRNFDGKEAEKKIVRFAKDGFSCAQFI